MPKVIILDKNGEEHIIEVTRGTTLSDACERAKVDFQYSCGKGGWCATCVVNILEGKIGPPEDDDTALTALDTEELETCERFEIDPSSQTLSCSCQVLGDCKIAAPEF